MYIIEGWVTSSVPSHEDPSLIQNLFLKGEDLNPAFPQGSPQLLG